MDRMRGTMDVSNRFDVGRFERISAPLESRQEKQFAREVMGDGNRIV